MALQLVLCDAIRAHRLVRFTYDGYERVVEPYVYGVNTAGHEVLLAWLVGGWSSSEPEPGWRTFLASGMRNVAALAEPFEPRVSGMETSRFLHVHCRVD